MKKSPDQFLEEAIAAVKSMRLTEGTASNRLINHEFKSSDLSSYTYLLQNLARTDLAAVQKSL